MPAPKDPEKHRQWREKLSKAHKGKKHTEETKRKMSESRKGENSPMYGRQHTEDSKRKISEKRKGKCVGKDNPMFGRHLTEETKRKISENRKGKGIGRKPWNTGLTKDDHPSLQKIAEQSKVSAKKLWQDPEFQKNQKEGMADPEVRRKISESQKGREHSEEEKERNSKRMKEYANHPEVRARLSRHWSMENNPNWQGGISFEPYDPAFNDILKEIIRERDGYICQLCGNLETENGRKLDIHHIDGDKKNSDPINLISLCPHCHTSNLQYNEKISNQLSMITTRKTIIPRIRIKLLTDFFG
ncbi:hypothetical protein ES703_60623 [subsurface metagenome]